MGLVLDIIGVLLLFQYGLPSKYKEEDVLSLGSSSEEEIERAKYNRKIKIGAYTGLSLILIGFIFQLIGTNIEWFKKIF